MSKIPSPLLQMESWARCLEGCIFSSSRENCIFFFQFPFRCITAWRKGFGLQLSFTSQREPRYIPDMDFFPISSFILSHLELLRIELTKLTSSILMEILTIPIGLVDQFYFYMHQLKKAWLFETIIFELDYHWASLSLHFHIVLKSLVSY